MPNDNLPFDDFPAPAPAREGYQLGSEESVSGVMRQLDSLRAARGDAPEGTLTPEGAEYAQKLVASRNYHLAQQRADREASRQAVADYAARTNGQSFYESAHAEGTPADSESDAPAKFDGRGFASALGLGEGAEFADADADETLATARQSIETIMGVVDDSQLLDAVSSDPRKFAAMQTLVTREIDKLCDPFFSVTGQRTAAQNELIEAATLNIVKMQMAHGRLGTGEVPLASLVQRARLVMDKNWAPGKRSAMPPALVEPQGNFSSIHAAYAANPW